MSIFTNNLQLRTFLNFDETITNSFYKLIPNNTMNNIDRKYINSSNDNFINSNFHELDNILSNILSENNITNDTNHNFFKI